MSDMTDIDRQIEFDDALARVFSRVDKAKKDAENDFFSKGKNKSMYTTLTSVDAACREALISESFSWPQSLDARPGDDPGVYQTVTTHLKRKGLEFVSSVTLKITGDGGPQKAGAAFTYARRFGLSAAVGVCPDDDDDGNSASRRTRGVDPAMDFKEDLAKSEISWHEVADEAGILPKGRPTDDELAKLRDAFNRLKKDRS